MNILIFMFNKYTSLLEQESNIILTLTSSLQYWKAEGLVHLYNFAFTGK